MPPRKGGKQPAAKDADTDKEKGKETSVLLDYDVSISCCLRVSWSAMENSKNSMTLLSLEGFVSRNGHEWIDSR